MRMYVRALRRTLCVHCVHCLCCLHCLHFLHFLRCLTVSQPACMHCVHSTPARLRALHACAACAACVCCVLRASCCVLHAACCVLRAACCVLRGCMDYVCGVCCVHGASRAWYAPHVRAACGGVRGIVVCAAFVGFVCSCRCRCRCRCGCRCRCARCVCSMSPCMVCVCACLRCHGVAAPRRAVLCCAVCGRCRVWHPHSYMRASERVPVCARTYVRCMHCERRVRACTACEHAMLHAPPRAACAACVPVHAGERCMRCLQCFLHVR